LPAEWVSTNGRSSMAAPRTQTVMESINPATEQVIARLPVHGEGQVHTALDQAQRAFRFWRATSFHERANLMRQAARYLRDQKTRLAGLMTAEMGKPIVDAEAEIEKCAFNCDYFAENAERFLAIEPHASNATESYVAFDPLGTVFGIMPWNFPFWQVFRFAAPTIMAGNTVVIKHASNVPQSALAIEEVFTQSGFPAGIFQTLLISGSTAEQLIADPRIAAVTLTGSDAAGRKVGAAAGAAIKKSVLELGGSDAFIVLADADLEAAATTAARARNQNTGQTCIAAKRIIVEESILEPFLERFAAAVQEIKVGDPMDRGTQMGPMARLDLVEALDRQVKSSIVDGADVIVGGQQPRPGYYYTPAILSRVTPGMAVYREETFGPVAAVVGVQDADEAVAVANDSPYGLGAALWSTDLDRARRLAREIEAGAVAINGMVASHPALPFGGVKQSGHGRELSAFGIREFTNIKSVWIGPARKEKEQSSIE
jgi:acyl-CoA reductase-like NAD-dependent aldehyde dehydrogenase